MEKKINWFALYVTQNKEFYIKDKLEAIPTFSDGQSGTVLLPTIQEISEVRRKKIVRNIPAYPGYLFIRTKLTSDLQSEICQVTYVIRFLGNANQPQMIRDEEMDIVKAIANNETKTQCAFSYKIGDMIEILGGHCKGLSGRIIDVHNINSLKVEIQIFNRAIYATIKLEDVKAA